MKKKNYLEELAELTGRITSTSAFERKAHGIVFGKMLLTVKNSAEVTEIAKDAVAHVRKNFLRLLDRHGRYEAKPFRYKEMYIALYGDDERSRLEALSAKALHDRKILKQSSFNESVRKHPITFYLCRGVARYCDTRLRRWSLENEKGNYGARSRLVIDKKHQETEFWDELCQHTDSEAQLFDAREYLEKKKVKSETIDYIILSLAGCYHTEIAAALGKKAETVRKAIGAGLKKAGLPEIKSLKNMN